MKDKKRTEQITETAGKKIQKEKEGKKNTTFPFQ